MNSILSASSIAKQLGNRELFRDLTLSFARGSRVGLIGRNGIGKSTLIKILAGIIEPDEGTIARSSDIKVLYVPQSEAELASCNDSIEEFLRQSFTPYGDVQGAQLVSQGIKMLLATACSDNAPEADSLVKDLSGGWQKRLCLVKCLVQKPDFLILDEPTNHLDFDGLAWLDTILDGFKGGFIITSHDRALLDTHCNRIIELSSWSSRLIDIDGNYIYFVSKRDEIYEAQIKESRSLANKAARELDWLRAGVKARTTKASARIKSANEVIDAAKSAKSRLNTKNHTVSAIETFTTSNRRTKELINIYGVSKQIGDKSLFSDLDLEIVAGECLALVGPNGSGKSTLMKLLTGEIKPDQGKIKYASHLQVAYYSQKRTLLPLEDTLMRALAPDGDTVMIGDKAINVNSWAKQLGFRQDQLSTLVKDLSGGEKARITLGQILQTKADILLLDEPTNDLDIETLELLETGLDSFPGAIVIVTHDRYLLKTLPDRLLALKGDGTTAILSSFDQWEMIRKTGNEQPNSKPNSAELKAKEVSKANYQDQKELRSLERKINKLETEIETTQTSMSNTNETSELIALTEKLASLNAELEGYYERWMELEN